MNNLKELLVKPVWQMTGEEFFSKQTRFGTGRGATAADHRHGKKVRVRHTRHSKLFGAACPQPTASRKSGKIDKAITQIGRKIIVDAELALELAGKKTEDADKGGDYGLYKRNITRTSRYPLAGIPAKSVKMLRKAPKFWKYTALSSGRWAISAHPSAKPRARKPSMYRLS